MVKRMKKLDPRTKLVTGVMAIVAVFIAVKPEQSEQVAEECVRLGIPRVWIHCMGGTSTAGNLNHGSTSTSVSSKAVQICRDNNIAVVPGACPMMFVENADFFHRFLRRIHSWTGKLRID